MDKTDLHQIEQITGYKFKDQDLLSLALTHSSGVTNRTHSNERLEFLGDSILSIVICQTLYERFPDYLEGDLTKIKSMLVSRRSCSRAIKEMGLIQYMKVGKGMAENRALTGSLAAGLLEAIIAAVYLDGGFDAARDFILKSFNSFIEQADAKQSQGNFKSLLQQYAQQNLNCTPIYELLDEKGPDHNKCFEIQVILDNQHFSSAWGTNKKEAEQKAAFKALVELGVLKGTLEENGS
ncbi:MAG: ribonuclease III [Planctomycetota bacterium]|jgi:ribonuclease-3